MQHQSPILELADQLVDSWREVSRCTAVFLRDLCEFDKRSGYEQWGLVDTAQWLDLHCGISRTTAREKVRVARALEGLPVIRGAFSAGGLSYSKARALTRVANPENEGELLDLADRCPASELEVRLREMENGGALESGDENDVARSWLTSRRVGADRVQFCIELCDEDAGILAEAVRVVRREMVESGFGGSELPDGPERSAQALVMMARRSLSWRFRGSGEEEDESEAAPEVPLPEASGPAHLVMVHVQETALNGSGGTSDLPTEAVRRLLCDGAVVGVVENERGEPLSVGRRTRTVPTGMRRALEARDRSCRFPGCGHDKWLDAHHIRHWADGGETSLENLVLLCGHHHRLLHEGEFQILGDEVDGHYFANRDGVPIGVDIGIGAMEPGGTSEVRTWVEDGIELSEMPDDSLSEVSASAEAMDDADLQRTALCACT